MAKTKLDCPLCKNTKYYMGEPCLACNGTGELNITFEEKDNEQKKCGVINSKLYI